MASANYGPKISILLVDDDETCCSIVATILQKMNHHVVAMKNPIDALSTLRMKGNSFDLVIADVDMLEMSGLELLKHVEKEFKLPVVLLSADKDKDIMLKCFDGGAVHYLKKPISPNKLSRIWQFVLPQSPTNNPLPSSAPNSLRIQDQLQMLDVNNNPNNNNVNNVYDFAPLYDGEHTENIPLIYNSNALKRPHADEMGKNDASVSKKPKLVWTTSLHNKFLRAVREFGLDKAVPKKILESMNVPGLKRENVASHLQKYRIFVKRIQAALNTMPYGFPYNWNERPFRSSFVLNEITYQSNNFQNFAAHKQDSVITNGGNVFEQGQSSTQVNDNYMGNTSPIVDTSFIPGDHIQLISPIQCPQTPNQNGSKNDQVPNFTSYYQGFSNGFSFEQEKNFQDEGVFTNLRVGNNVQTTINNNYAGLRVGPNEELVTPTVVDATNGGLANAMHGHGYSTNESFADAQEVNYYDMSHNANNFTSYDHNNNNATPLLDDDFFEIDNELNAFFNSGVDNNSTQQENNPFGMSQEMPNLDGIEEELRELGIEFPDQQPNGCDFGFGSIDAQGDAEGNWLDGLLDQGMVGDDNLSFESFFAEELRQGFNQQDSTTDFTKPN